MSLSVEDILAPGGLVASNLDNYEERREQLDMALAVGEGFEARRHVLAEAGTGVGKSFAYLVPSILQAADHKRRIVISTYTIALQEQLISKDLPFLADILPMEFNAVLGKGRTNYVCFRRLAMAIKSKDKLFVNESKLDMLETVARWAMETSDGSLQDIDFSVSPDVWQKVRAETGLCKGAKCDHYGPCHLRRARRRMLKADILVVNHAMFFSDLAMQAEDLQFLGRYDMVVLDEAHTVEQVAGDHFGRSVSWSMVRFLLRDIYNAKTDRGIITMIGDGQGIAVVNRAESAAESFFQELSSYKGPAIARNGRITREGVVPNILSPALMKLATMVAELRGKAQSDDHGLELLTCEQRAVEMASKLDALISQADGGHAYWVTRRGARKGRGANVTLASAPIDVAPLMRDLLFDKVASVVLTSATLATARGGAHGFDYIRTRLGLDDADEVLLTSPFDFRKQAKLHIETQLGDPNDLERFVPQATKAIEYYVRKSEGRCFVLMTSYTMLEAVADTFQGFCTDNEYHLLVQGRNLPRGAMLERFRGNRRTVLLGTASFWQGVDVAGEALQNVIIAKLPFAAPNDPIVEARIDAIRQGGGNPFVQYQLPEAIIRFKQGFGRLIRSTSDTGIVVVLDQRLVTKSYGKRFIASLPDIEMIRDEFSAQTS
ncbi:MAG: helicase C-terminal domain-containing protein [Phycisphaerae bacterium]|jgi:ATP-dependent DNA helicase DinG|nr:helicase C-terminal domain-containing protein [Phycisphaerae bacterium]